MVMKVKISVSLFLLVLILYCGPVSADVIEPGQKIVPYQYQIQNLDQYPQYIFVLHGTPSPELEVLNSSPFSFYKLSTVNIYAIPRSVFSDADLQSFDASQIEELFQEGSGAIPSNLVLEGTYDSVSVNDPLEIATVVLRIKSINAQLMEIEKVSVIFQYNNGKTEEKKFNSQNSTPLPSRPDFDIWLIILPILAGIAILGVFLIRRYK